MLNTFEDVLIVTVCVALNFAFLMALQRFWPGPARRIHNEMLGWQLSVLGTTYAVIVGFMLYAVWTTFQAAELNADNEANSLVNVFRLADGLPPDARAEVHQLAKEYAETVISQEWPAMHHAENRFAGHPVVQKMWSTVARVNPTNFGEQTSMDHALSELSSMTEYRRRRELQSQSNLPTILWIVMILGGFITLFCASLMGTENFRLHFLQVLLLTLFISLTLVAIADIDRPFLGTVHVRPSGFERARQTFNSVPADFQ